MSDYDVIYCKGKIRKFSKTWLQNEAAEDCGNWKKWQNYHWFDRTIYSDPENCMLVEWPCHYRSGILVLRSMLEHAAEWEVDAPPPIWNGWYPGMVDYRDTFTYDDLAKLNYVAMFVKQPKTKTFVPTLPYILYSYMSRKYNMCDTTEPMDPICEEKYWPLDCELDVLTDLGAELFAGYPTVYLETKELNKFVAACVDWHAALPDTIEVYDSCVSDEVTQAVLREMGHSRCRLNYEDSQTMRARLDQAIKTRMTKYVKPIPFESLCSQNQQLLPLAMEIRDQFI